MEPAETLPSDPTSALSVLMTRFGDWVLRLAYLHVKNRHAAEDISQEVFIRVFKGWSMYRAESSIQTWLGKITINLCRDYYRRHGRELWYSTVDDHYDLETTIPTPEQTAIDQEKSDQIKRAIDELNDFDRSVLFMFYYFDLSTVEISKITGVRDGTLRSRMTRARQKLKTILEMEDIS